MGMHDEDDVRDSGINPPARPLSGMSAALAAPGALPGAMPGAMPATAVNPAEWMYQRLKKYIQEFEAHLDDDHEVGAHLVSFGHELTFHIQDIGYHGPDLITFYGRNDKGEDVQLIQHTSQLSVLLVAVRKQAAQPRRIGFVLDQKETPSEKLAGRADQA